MMEKYTLYIDNGVITIQSADYVEHGNIIVIENNVITLKEIPYGGGEPQDIGVYDSVIDAINAGKQLT